MDGLVPAEQIERWDELLSRGELDVLERELEHHHAEVLHLGADATALLREARSRKRAQLVVRGRGAMSDLLQYCLEFGSQGPAELVADGIRIVATAGARETAADLAARAEQWFPGDPSIAFATTQLQRNTLWGRSPHEMAVHVALNQGDRSQALRRAETWRDLVHPSDPERLAAERLIRSLVREQANFSLLLSRYDDDISSYAVADQAQIELEHGLDAWSAGEQATALTALRRARDLTRSEQQAGSRYVHAASSELLERIERDPAAQSPRWRCISAPLTRPLFRGGGSEILELLAWAHPAWELDLRSFGNTSTITHLRRALDAADVAFSRVLLTPTRIEAALRHEAYMILEQERPTDIGFSWLRGHDSVTDLLMLVEPERCGPTLVPMTVQQARCSLFNFSAMLIWGPGDEGRARRDNAAADDLAHDPDLDLVDACNLDDQGRAVPRARVAVLAERGIERAPHLPMLHRHRGESLLAKMERDEIAPGGAGEFERWLSATRTRFPDDEWPFQLYARALEIQARYAEAGIAWADAGLRDPWDYRNLLGEAKSWMRTGRFGRARLLLRKAESLAPAQVAVHNAATALFLRDRDHLDRATLHSQLAIEVAPDDLQAMANRATILERGGDLERAGDVFGRLAERTDVGPWARTRAAQRCVHAGQWQRARDYAQSNGELYPGSEEVWEQLTRLSWAEARADDALESAFIGLQRCGPSDGLLYATVRVLVDLMTHRAGSGWLMRLLDQLDGAPRAIESIARMLAESRRFDDAVETLEYASERSSRDLNGEWMVARVLSSHPELRREHGSRIADALRMTTARASGFPYPAIMLAADLLDRHQPQQARTALENVDVDRAPALVWELTARTFEAEGDQAKAAKVRARLPEVYPSGVLEDVSFLRGIGRACVARDMLLPVVDHLENRDSRVEAAIAQCELDLGQAGTANKRWQALLAADPQFDDGALAAAAALAASDWDTLEAMSNRAIQANERDSSDLRDAWDLRGFVAATARRRGDDSGIEQMHDLAPRHPGAWEALAKVELAAGMTTIGQTLQHLKEFAPGAWARLEREQTR